MSRPGRLRRFNSDSSLVVHDRYRRTENISDSVDDINTILAFVPSQYRITNKTEAFTLISGWTFCILTNSSKEDATSWIHKLGRIIQEITDYELSDQDPIYMLLDVCYYFKIGDTGLVVKVLKMLHSLGALEYYFCKTFSLPPFAESLKFSEHFNSEIAVLDQTHYPIYFLEAAKKEREDFDSKWFGKDSAELVHYCVLYGLTEALQILLRYGFRSSASCYQNIFDGSCRKPPTFKDLCLYNWCLEDYCLRPDVSHVSKKVAVIGTALMKIMNISQNLDKTLWFYDATEQSLEILLDNLSLLFSVIPIPIGKIPLDVVEKARTETGPIYELLYDDQAPCSLSTLCRFRIRDSLAESWQLPEGCYALPLPKRICASLNVDL